MDWYAELPIISIIRYFIDKLWFSCKLEEYHVAILSYFSGRHCTPGDVEDGGNPLSIPWTYGLNSHPLSEFISGSGEPPTQYTDIMDHSLWTMGRGTPARSLIGPTGQISSCSPIRKH